MSLFLNKTGIIHIRASLWINWKMDKRAELRGNPNRRCTNTLEKKNPLRLLITSSLAKSICTRALISLLKKGYTMIRRNHIGRNPTMDQDDDSAFSQLTWRSRNEFSKALERLAYFYTVFNCFLFSRYTAFIYPLFTGRTLFFLQIAMNTSVLRALWRKTKSLWFNVKLELTFKSYCALFSYKLIRICREINHFSFHCPVQSLCIIHKPTKSMKIKKQQNKIFAKGTREFTEPTELLYLLLKCTYSGNKDFQSLILKKYLYLQFSPT